MDETHYRMDGTERLKKWQESRVSAKPGLEERQSAVRKSVRALVSGKAKQFQARLNSSKAAKVQNSSQIIQSGFQTATLIASRPGTW